MDDAGTSSEQEEQRCLTDGDQVKTVQYVDR